ncbi:MAG: T9SS type A sorting domain-containing protein, partial [Bacteroidetes bacterium]|nr:T9SS type A sorting domain-containing protein [Bacteroidota bacterium]
LRNIEWQQCYGGLYHEFGSNIIELVDGYICLGMASSDDGDVSGYHGYPGYPEFGGDIWVFKIDLTGNLLWQKCLGGTFMEYANNIFTTSDGGFMVVGQTSSDDGDVEGYHGTTTQLYDDIWMAKITADGELTWQYCYGGTGKEYIYRGVIQKGDYNYVMAIGTDTDDWQCRGQRWPDVRVFELADTTTDIIQSTNESAISVYPNPAVDRITFRYSLGLSTNPGNLTIFSSRGVIIDKVFLHSGIDNINYDISHLSPGLYYYNVITEENTITGKFIVKD